MKKKKKHLKERFFFRRKVLELNHSEGIHDLGYIKWDMAGCLFLVYLICYFSLWKGISTSGKVEHFSLIFIQHEISQQQQKTIEYFYPRSYGLLHCFRT